MEDGSGCRAMPQLCTIVDHLDLTALWALITFSGQSTTEKNFSCAMWWQWWTNSLCSDVEAKDFQLQLEQTLSKEEAAFCLQERTRPAKSSRPRKPRRSPYPHFSHTEYPSADYSSNSSLERPPTQYPDYSTTMESMAAAQIQQQVASYPPSIMYPANQEAMDSRYLYTSAAYSAGLYGEAMSMYPYSTHRYFDERSTSYRGHFDEKYYPSRDMMYPGCMPGAASQSSHQDSPRGISSSSPLSSAGRESATCQALDSSQSRLNTYESCIHSAPASQDCSHMGKEASTFRRQCSQAFSMSYSSKSTPEVTNSDGESCCTNPDSSLQLSHDKTDGSQLEEKPVGVAYNDSASVDTTSHAVEGVSPDIAHQSVIIRCQQHQSSTISPHTPSSNLTGCSQEAPAKLSQVNGSSPESQPGVHSPAESSSIYTSTASCTFEPYKQSGYQNSAALPGQRSSYPMMPQAGYTSVIVDAQQYHHMANGYVHWWLPLA